jgi:hypothetical protein
MSNYLNQLVAKNLNLVDTVQPFLLSVFGFLPESVPEMGSEESWEINQEIVMGSGDSAITTELETSSQAQILANSEIMQRLELQAMAAPTSSPSPVGDAARTETLPRTTNTNQLQTSGDINNPLSTSLIPGLTHYWEQPPTATSFLADKSDSQPSSSQPESVAMTPIMQEVKHVLDTQPLTLPMAVEQPTTALYKIGMKNEPPKPQEIDLQVHTEHQITPEIVNIPTISERQQAVKSHPAVSLTVEEMISSGQSPTMLEPEAVVIRTSDKVLPTVERQPLRSATPNPPEDYCLGSRGAEITSVILHQEGSSNVEAITPLSASAVKSHKQSVPFLSKEPGIEINRFVPSSPSSKVMRAQVDSHQSQPQSVAIAPDRSFVLGAETQQSTPAPMLETNTRFPAVAQLTQPATESLEQQAVKIYPSDSRLLSPKAIGSEQSRNQLKSEPVSRERTSVQVPTQEIVSIQHTSLSQDRPLGTPNILPDFSQNRENLSPASPEALNSPPKHDGKGSKRLGFALSFPDEVTSQNILQPINDDSRRGSVFLSASRQEQRQGESFGNSTTPPTIKVSIGSMEIRTPPTPPPRPKARPKPPVISLDEYLRQRSRGR